MKSLVIMVTLLLSTAAWADDPKLEYLESFKPVKRLTQEEVERILRERTKAKADFQKTLDPERIGRFKSITKLPLVIILDTAMGHVWMLYKGKPNYMGQCVPIHQKLTEESSDDIFDRLQSPKRQEDEQQ